MLNIFKKTYFIFLLVAGLAMVFYLSNASAKEGSIEDVKYHNCESHAGLKYQALVRVNPQIFERGICKFLDVEVGPVCEDKMQVLYELGFLRDEVDRFVTQTVIEPACGPHPY